VYRIAGGAPSPKNVAREIYWYKNRQSIFFFFLLTSSNRQLCEEKELEPQNEKQKNKQNVQPWHYSATPPTAACAPLAPIPTR
jgi:hypothetical protein